MTPERWRQVEEIFQTALDLAPGERAPYLERACGEDAGLRREVEAMLAQYDEASDFLDRPLVDQKGFTRLADALDEADADPLVGQRVGAYKIEREIARGGMGVVYLATRADQAFRMRAAVKVIKRGMDSDFILRRFRHERQILASLEHPNITLLLDGGATETGQPYFVMEYVEGEPLYAYCDARRLPLRERLRLFAQVCDAIDYAHRRQVVHRDIKPSNILVTRDGVPKLFDFGIAKLLDPTLSPDTAPQTATAMRMMTVDYASPEQVQGFPVTLLSDVYSLGVLLYELLTGHRPYSFRTRLQHEVARVITEAEPERPSATVTRSDNLLRLSHIERDELTVRHVSELRGETPESLARALAGGLDRVVLQALRKDPGERYQSAAELREDIERHLKGQPVKAPAHLAAPPARLPATPRDGPGAHAEQSQPTKTVAVLPLKLLDAGTGGETGESYLGVGLADAISTRLSKVRSFVLRPVSSAMRLQDTGPFDAGRELNVEYVLDGNIRRAGERIRVTVQLLDVNRRSTQWAESFDERFTDVLELEDSISEQVATSLVPRLTGEERKGLSRRGTDNPQAHEAYMRGRYFWNQFSPETFPKALDALKRAVALDPDYALAYAGIASYYNWASIFGFVPPDEGYEKTRAAARRALELDDSLGDAYAVLGFTAAFSEWNWAEAERLLKKSMELSPSNGLAYEWYSAMLAGVGREEEGVRHILRAEELDPLSPRPMALTAWTLYQLRRFPQSLAKAEEMIDLNPHFWQGHVQRGNVLLELGRAEEALEELRTAYRLEPESGIASYPLVYALVANDRRAEAVEVLEKLKRIAATRYVNAYHLAMCHAALGERDAAFDEFDRAQAVGDLWLVWLATEPKLDPLRDDERLDDLLRRTNRPHLVRSGAPQGPKRAPASIGILPFKLHPSTGGENAEDKFLEIGLTDALITRLSKIRSLVLRPAGSVMRLWDAGPYEAGRELNVEYVLDGNIRRAGERVRVTVQLFDVARRSTRWAESFDEEFTDVLGIEDSISGKVAHSLVPRLTGEERRRLGERGTDNPQAHEAYLRGRYFWYQFSNESLPKALEWFQRAVHLDPDYALAHAAIADFYNWAGILGIMPSLECYEAGRRAARRALELDDQLSEAHAVSGFLTSVYEWDWDAGERLYRRALELNPNNSLAHEWLSAVLLGTGRVEEGLAEMRRSEELDPVSLRQMTLMAWTLYQARRFTEAIEKAREMVEMDRNYWQGHFQLGNACLHVGRAEEAVESLRESLRLVPDSGATLYALAFALVAAGRHAEAREILDRLKASAAARYVKPYFLAMTHAALGEHDAAFEWFERARLDRGGWLVFLTTEPKLDPLRDDPRFDELLRRLNLPAPPRASAETTGSDKSIAVLPLKLLGAATGGADDYLGVGLADTLITRLSNVRRFVVRPTASVLRFADNADPFAAGRELAVRYVLDGYIRRAGTRLRITLQLLDVRAAASVWAEQFNGEDTDVLSLEDSIASQVARSLVPQLSGEEQAQVSKRGTDNPEAYEAYLRGRFHWNLMTEEGFAKSIGFYERAVSLDPSYALAHTAIVEYYIFLGIQCVLPFSESARRSKEAAERAAAIDPTLAEAQAALGTVAINHDFDWKRAEAYNRRAVEMNPNSFMANQWLKTLYLQTGRFGEALRQAERLLEIAPDSMIGLHFLAWTYHNSRRLDDSIRVHRQLVEESPLYAFGRLSFSWTLRCAGEVEEAVAQARKGLELAPRNPIYTAGVATALAGAGRLDEARETLARTEQMSASRYVSPYMLAVACCALGDREGAFAQLEKALAIRDVWVVWIGVEPQFDPLRADPRFGELLRRMNHPLAPK